MLFTVLVTVFLKKVNIIVTCKKTFDKELVMTEKDDEDLESSTQCWICDDNYVDSDVKVRDRYHISEKYRGSAQEALIISKLN